VRDTAVKSALAIAIFERNLNSLVFDQAFARSSNPAETAATDRFTANQPKVTKAAAAIVIVIVTTVATVATVAVLTKIHLR
jgi:hypothetical protein